MKKITLLIFLLFYANLAAQKSSDIERKIDLAFQQFSQVKLQESIESAYEALEMSTKTNYKTGIIKSNLYIAKVLLEIGEYNKALNYIENAENQSIFQKNPSMIVESHRLKGILFTYSDLYDKGIYEFRSQLKMADSLEDTLNRKLARFWAYQNLVFHYDKKNQLDSVLSILKKQELLMEEFELKDHTISYLTTYNQLGKSYTKAKQYDSAQLYFEKAESLIKKFEIPYTHATDEGLAEIYSKQGDSAKSVVFYQKALKNASELGMPQAEMNYHKILSEYFKYNDTQKYLTHTNQFIELNDYLIKTNATTVASIVDYLTKKERKITNQKSKKYLMLGGFFFILILSYSIYSHRKMKRRLKSKKNLIAKDEKVIQYLSERVHTEKFNQLIESVKSNSPEFLVLFTELYPDFIAALKARDPSIKPSELTFCAQLYLNFSTKDIAEYTFVTIRAVQIRKNRLRKKFNIDSDVDLNKWMLDLVQ